MAGGKYGPGVLDPTARLAEVPANPQSPCVAHAHGPCSRRPFPPARPRATSPAARPLTPTPTSNATRTRTRPLCRARPPASPPTPVRSPASRRAPTPVPRRTPPEPAATLTSSAPGPPRCTLPPLACLADGGSSGSGDSDPGVRGTGAQAGSDLPGRFRSRLSFSSPARLPPLPRRSRQASSATPGRQPPPALWLPRGALGRHFRMCLGPGSSVLLYGASLRGAPAPPPPRTEGRARPVRCTLPGVGAAPNPASPLAPAWMLDLKESDLWGGILEKLNHRAGETATVVKETTFNVVSGRTLARPPRPPLLALEGPEDRTPKCAASTGFHDNDPTESSCPSPTHLRMPEVRLRGVFF
ncbi:hypothetical protein LEMLEM_LOCUS19500 [Lemmus lemmus]